MTPNIELILFLLVLLGLVLVVYVSVVRSYYWWGRGTPPPIGEEKARLKEEELRLRPKQIEYSDKHPRETRNTSFWNNRKVYKKGE